MSIINHPSDLTDFVLRSSGLDPDKVAEASFDNVTGVLAVRMKEPITMIECTVHVKGVELREESKCSCPNRPHVIDTNCPEHGWNDS